jgi:tRNA (guanine37-N1)-methyltransferase
VTVRIDVVTIFPDYLAPLELSLPGRARRRGLLDLHVHDLRRWAHDRHRTVDDTPYGGGPGMVMRPEPWGEALDELITDSSVLVVPSPSGRRFDQTTAEQLAAVEHLVIACGRYEGIDQRVLEHAATRTSVLEVSLGDYVLNGGEVAALAVVEAVVRLLPGFMGNPSSLTEESHTDGLLEYPVYTRPATWRGLAVPDVLLSGDHERVARWRHEQARRRTAERRPDLLAPADLVDVGVLEAAAADVEWRRATPADAGELLTLQLACWVGEAKVMGSLDVVPALHESLDDVVGDLERWETWVLRSAGRLVASVRGRRSDDDQTWVIGRLMVAPDLRGRGLGRWLLARAEERAPDDVAACAVVAGDMILDNHRMYRRAGYHPRGPAAERAVWMVKQRP